MAPLGSMRCSKVHVVVVMKPNYPVHPLSVFVPPNRTSLAQATRNKSPAVRSAFRCLADRS